MALTVPDGIDPDLARSAELQPDLDYADPPAVRAALRRALAVAKVFRSVKAAADRLVVSELEVPVRPGAGVLVRRYDPMGRVGPSPALVFFHGGAFVAGDLDTEDTRCRELAGRSGALVLSVDYRLAPEHPFPAGFDDCYGVTAWVVREAAALGVDPARVMVGGCSAGGALAAAVALAARDRGGPPIALQLLLYPVIDDALATRSMARFASTPGWTGPNSVHMWRHYLSGRPDGDVPPYAAPARASSLTGLPPAYVLTAEFDPLRDEGVEYARRLLAAGVPTELHHFAGAYHGFDAAAPAAAAARRALDEQCAMIATAPPATASVPAPESAARSPA